MDIWILIALSALTLGFYDIARKDAVRNNDVISVLFLSTLSGAVALLLISILTKGEIVPIWRIPFRIAALLCVKVLLVGVSWGAVFCAMRRLPISLAAPIRATSPFWTLLGAILLFGEWPTPIRAIGMLLMPIGYILLASTGRNEGFSWKSREMTLIVLGTLFGSASALYDKHLLARLQLPPDAVQTFFAAGLCVLYGGTFLARKLLSRSSGKYTPAFRFRWTIIAAGVLLIVSDYFYFRAVASPDAAIS
ncbi:MAG: EamA family transporter, partial [Kiritimatiellia bacterium]